jgi:hypothetical protein
MGEASQDVTSSAQVSLELPLEAGWFAAHSGQDEPANVAASQAASAADVTPLRRHFQRLASAAGSGLRVATGAEQGECHGLSSAEVAAENHADDAVDAQASDDTGVFTNVKKLAKRLTMNPGEAMEFDDAGTEVDIMPMNAIQKPHYNGLFIEGFLNPHGNLRLLWDFCMVMFLCYTMFSEPVFMGFEIDPEGTFHVLEYVVIVFFLLDVCLNFRTAFENSVNKTLVTNQRQIAWRYLTGWFLIDMCSSLPFELFIPKDDSSGAGVSRAKVGAKIFKSTKFTKAIKIVRLLKLTKLARTVNYVHEIEDFLGALYSALAMQLL